MVRSEDAAKINRIVETAAAELISVRLFRNCSAPENKLEDADKHDIIVDGYLRCKPHYGGRPVSSVEPTSNSGKLLNGDEKLKPPSVRKELSKIQKKSSVAPSHQRQKRKRTKSNQNKIGGYRMSNYLEEIITSMNCEKAL